MSKLINFSPDYACKRTCVEHMLSSCNTFTVWADHLIVMGAGAEELQMMLDELKQVTSTVEGCQYSMDHTGCCMILGQKLAQGVKVRIICDKGQFYYCSCARQPKRVKELFDAGAEFRVHKP